MKWALLTTILFLVASTCVAQSPVVVYWVDMTPRPSQSRRVQPPPYNPLFDGPRSWAPGCSTTTAYDLTPNGYWPALAPANQYVRWIALDKVKMENLSCLTKLRYSLSEDEYREYAKRANALDDNRSARLRAAILKLPSEMRGTTYVGPSAKSVWAALEQVEQE